MPKRQLTGIVVSDKMQKTVVVRVERTKMHPKYRKRFRVSKNYKAHTDQEYKVGDEVMIQECRPVSKDKKWRVVNKIKSSKLTEPVKEEEHDSTKNDAKSS